MRSQAYVDCPLKQGHLHLSAPHMYVSALNALELEPRNGGLPPQSFLNIGSGTGYFSALASQLCGPKSTQHGIEIYEDVISHAKAVWDQLRAESLAQEGQEDEAKLELPEVTFYHGNVFALEHSECTERYERIYVGAACPRSALPRLVQLLEVGGLMVGPFGDDFLQVKRIGESKEEMEIKFITRVRFSPLLSAPLVPFRLQQIQWTTKHHPKFPDHFRRTVFEILLCAHRLESPASHLPKGIWHHIFGFTSRLWFTPPPSRLQRLGRKLQAALAARKERSLQKARESEQAKKEVLYYTILRRLQLGVLVPSTATAGAAASASAGDDDSDSDMEDSDGSAAGPMKPMPPMAAPTRCAGYPFISYQVVAPTHPPVVHFFPYLSTCLLLPSQPYYFLDSQLCICFPSSPRSRCSGSAVTASEGLAPMDAKAGATSESNDLEGQDELRAAMEA
ncbi:unnamed protein product [Chrysoparadoxa australica]